MRRNLTDDLVAKIQPKSGKRFEVWDTKQAGFGVRVTENGSKSFVVLYRFNGKARRLTLGSFPKHTVESARQAATLALASVIKEIDPGAAKKAALIETRQAKLETVAAVCELYLEKHAKQKKDGGRADANKIKANILPVWGERPIASIRRKDVIALLDGVARRGEVMANRVRALLSKLFNFAIAQDLIDANPAFRVERRKEKPRDRVLTDTELRAVWGQFEAEPFRFMLLTGQREGEIFGMTWSELDGDIWTIPSARAKNGKSHRVPLNASAAALIASLPRVNDYVFGRKFSAWMIQDLWGKVAERAGLADAHIHDIRRTAASIMAKADVLPAIIGKVLNHTAAGVTEKVYIQYSYDREKRVALATLDREIQRIVSGEPERSNVVDFPARASA